MKKHPLPYWAVAALAVIAITPAVKATTNVWTGTSGSDIFWSTPGNWSPSGPPGAGDEARFFNPGAVNDTTPDNVVTADTTIERLWIGQTNPPNHNMTINSGVTLTIMGTADNGYGPLGSDPAAGGITADPVPTRVMSTIYIGTKTTNNSTQVVIGKISGGGTLIVSNLNNEINVRQFHPTGAAHRGILDLSGLNTFVAKLGRIRIGDGEAQPENRAEGNMYLAATNNITLSGSNYQDNVQLVVGNNDVNQNQGNPSFLILGGQNVLNLDEMLVGGKKQPGTMRSTNGFPSLTLKMRGSDGVGRVRAIRIGDASDQPTSGNGTTGIANFTDDTVDILADTVTVGKSQATGTGAGSLSLGTLLLGPGTFDVNTLDVAFRMDNNAGTASATKGGVDFSNTVVTVNSLLRLGRNVPGQRPMLASLALNGGSVTVRSNLVIQGAVSVTNINGLLAFVQPNALTVSNLFLSGGTISNASLISATNSLTIANNGAIVGNTAFDMGNDASKSWDVTGVAGGSLVSSNSFFGGGTLNGNLVQGNGGIVGAGGDGTVGTLIINGNLTLNTGALNFDLGNNAFSGDDQINVGGTVTLSGTNDVNLTALVGGFDTVSPYTLITSTVLIGNQTRFRAAGPLALSRYTFTFDTTTSPNNVRMIVGGTGAKNLTWVGDGSANLWNAQGAANWNDGSGASTFFTLDNVSFTDSGFAIPAVSLVGTLIPGTMTVNNATKAYGFGGTGSLAVGGTLTKSGVNSLTFTNGAGNSFNSLVSVQNGTLVFGNAGQNTFKNGIALTGTGALVLTGNNTNTITTSDGSTALIIGVGTSVTVSNAGANLFPNPIQLDGTFTFNQAGAATLDGNISGAGALIKNGAGTLTINGANSGLTTNVVIYAGTVKAGSGTALGAGGVVITNSATLDLVGINLNGLPAIVSGTGVGGTGAIVSTGPPLVSGNAGIGLNGFTMAGDTTVGGSGPWDTDPVKNLGVWGINNGALSTGSSNYNLVKVGLNQFGLSGSTTVDPALGNIDVQQGLLALQGSVSSLGDPGSNITVRAGATVSFFDTSTPWIKNFILFGDGATANLFNYDGANTIVGPITLNGPCVVGAAPLSRGTAVSLTLAGTIGGTGGLIKSGLDAVILTGTNSYTGGTLVNAGRLVLDGLNTGSGALTNVSGSTIAGIGTNNGAVVVGGTFSPGDDSTTFAAFGTGPLTLNGSTLVFDVDNSASDSISVNGNLTLSGTIGIQLNLGTLTVGQSYPLIHYTGSLIGGTNGLQLLPLLPGYTINLYSNANTIGIMVGYLPIQKVWKGGTPGATTLWNTTTLNWLNAGNPDVFNAGDFATFDDTGTNIVTLVGSLPSAGVILNNSTKNYFFGGAGKLTGVGDLEVNGFGSLTITNSGSNDFTGGITVGIGGGYLVIGSGGTNGSTGNGPITNLSAISFNKSGTNVVNNNFYGSGFVTNVAGVLLLNGDNSQADMNLDVTNSSTLRAGSPTALGRNTGTTTIENGSSLDVNGQNLGLKSVTVSGNGVGGNGAIINSGLAQNSALQSIILTGDTRFGGATRWDLRAGTVSSLSTSGSAFSITKVGTNQISLVSITNVDAALADIDIQQGTFAVQNNTGQLGDPSRTVFVRTGATLDLFNLNLNPLNKTINMANSSVLTNESGISVIIGPISIVGKVTFGVTNSLIVSNIDQFTASGTVTNITKTGAGILTLAGNSLPSSTLVDIVGGTIDINQQSTGSTLTLGSGQTLRGNGNLAGALQANAGSVVAPGETIIGTLTVSNSIVLGGTNIMKISKTANTNDVLRTSGSITFGGTLVVTNIAGTIVGGETYKLFSAASYSGLFITNLPPLSAGLSWNTNNLNINGTISVLSSIVNPTTNAAITKVTLVGTNLVVHGTNNNVPNTSFHYVVLTTTNVATALSNWTPVLTNTFTAGGTFDYTNPIVPGSPRQFIDVKAAP